MVIAELRFRYIAWVVRARDDDGRWLNIKASVYQAQTTDTSALACPVAAVPTSPSCSRNWRKQLRADHQFHPGNHYGLLAKLQETQNFIFRFFITNLVIFAALVPVPTQIFDPPGLTTSELLIRVWVLNTQTRYCVHTDYTVGYCVYMEE